LTSWQKAKRYKSMANAATQKRASPQIAADRKLYAPRKFTARTKARFIADRTIELLRHLGRTPSYPEKIIISRVVAIEWNLRRTDAKLDDGQDLSGHDIRGRLAAENRLRLDLAALGLKPAAPKVPTLAELFPADRVVA
jgi:hypothetical protein